MVSPKPAVQGRAGTIALSHFAGSNARKKLTGASLASSRETHQYISILLAGNQSPFRLLYRAFSFLFAARAEKR
jgi:hypothetical protein